MKKKILVLFEAFNQNVSRKIIEIHGGTLTVHREGPNRGTNFLIEIPRQKFFSFPFENLSTLNLLL
ncbi:MAG: hypothetical protein ACXAC8_15705 [Candidatus Hodarchaeales archaeon]